jgi:hypothetical protein
VIWDDVDDKGKKVWYRTPLGPGRKTPDELDIDGVTSFTFGGKITNLNSKGEPVTPTEDWWWLDRGAEVEIKDGNGMQTIVKTSLTGSIRIFPDVVVSGDDTDAHPGWGVVWVPFDPTWGDAL